MARSGGHRDIVQYLTNPPALPARTSGMGHPPKRYLLFFSYAQKDTVTETSRLNEAATQRFPQAEFFHEKTSKLSELVGHVQEANNVVVLLSGNYPKRAFTLVELHFALKSGARVCGVKVTRPGMEPFDFEAVRADIKSGKIKDYLSEDGWDTLGEYGITVEEVSKDLETVMNTAASPLSFKSSSRVQNAQIEDILDRIYVPGG